MSASAQERSRVHAVFDNVPANERTQICRAGGLLGIRWTVSELVVNYRWSAHAAKASGADVCELRRDSRLCGKNLLTVSECVHVWVPWSVAV